MVLRFFRGYLFSVKRVTFKYISLLLTGSANETSAYRYIVMYFLSQTVKTRFVLLCHVLDFIRQQITKMVKLYVEGILHLLFRTHYRLFTPYVYYVVVYLNCFSHVETKNIHRIT